MYLTDYHIHTNASEDCRETLDNMCQSAILKNINEIAVTDHYDPTQNDPFCEKTYNYKTIQDQIAHCREKYAGKLMIRNGVELGQSNLYPQSAQKLLEHDFDYVIGSVHNLKGDIDLARVKYTPHCDALFTQYLADLLVLAKNGHYDCIGHLNYPARYAIYAGYRFKLRKFYDQIRAVLKTVISQGNGIEVNCSGFRNKRLLKSLPDFPIVKLYSELGGEIITVGTDAHTTKHVGLHLMQGYELIREAGFDYITTFENRKPTFIKI